MFVTHGDLTVLDDVFFMLSFLFAYAFLELTVLGLQVHGTQFGVTDFLDVAHHLCVWLGLADIVDAGHEVQTKQVLELQKLAVVVHFDLIDTCFELYVFFGELFDDVGLSLELFHVDARLRSYGAGGTEHNFGWMAFVMHTFDAIGQPDRTEDVFVVLFQWIDCHKH